MTPASLEQRSLARPVPAPVLPGSDALDLLWPLVVETDGVNGIVVGRHPVSDRPLQQGQQLPPVHPNTRHHCTPPQLTA